ncbi:MAG: BBE domain-containing protein [Solirubrobacterales bacterium]|nr:BBE domain-containing protein [Solirubrobacterales bacterium]
MPAGATAVGNRSARFLVNLVGTRVDPAKDQANNAWVRTASEAMEPHGTGARYVNFLGDEGEASVRSAYQADTYTRLQDLKARYDPTNLSTSTRTSSRPSPTSPTAAHSAQTCVRYRGGPVMFGYSGTPLWRKLGVKPSHTVAVLGQPTGWVIEGLPEDVVLRSRAQGPLEAIVAFFDRRSEVERRRPVLVRALHWDGSIWIAWPRKATGHVSHISENDLRAIILPTGLVDTKVAALDEDWSGLKFVWRKERRSRPGSASD